MAPQYVRCRYPGCTVTGLPEWLRPSHETQPHVRCACGWVGGARGWGSHRAQAIRRSRAADMEPTTVHEIIKEIPPLDHGA